MYLRVVDGNESSSTAAAALPSSLPGSSGSGDSIFERWIAGLACLMDGNWFSTQKAGECLPDGSNKETCWWRLESSVDGTKPVNADFACPSCVRFRFMPACAAPPRCLCYAGLMFCADWAPLDLFCLVQGLARSTQAAPMPGCSRRCERRTRAVGTAAAARRTM